MPSKKHTSLSTNFRDNLIKEMKRIIATNPGVPNRSAFAKSIGVSSAHIHTWESGSRYPTIEHLIKMRNLYGLDMNALMDGREPQALKSLNDFERRLSEAEKKLEMVEQLNPEAIKKPIKNRGKKLAIKYFFHAKDQ